jgi:magnesium transporter
MKFMAAMTIVLSVPNIFTSFFGQNIPLPFDGTAFTTNPWPFAIILTLCVSAVALTVWLLNRRDMF